jgi:glycosyltransferase involved in cell wall biosynthesis
MERIQFGPPADPRAPRFHFIANGMFGDGIGGGDVHFFEMAKGVIAGGYRLHFFGSHALRKAATERLPAWELTLTEARPLPRVKDTALSGHLRLFASFREKCRNTIRCLDEIKPEEPVYGTTDYWYDAVPLVRCRATRKMMIVGMDAPTAKQILLRSRPDVTALRLNSIHYWASQNFSLRRFRGCPNKRLFYVHPTMKARLLKLGYREEELAFISNGMDLETAESVPAQEKQFDVLWIGRVHKQKGVDDLLTTLCHLRDRIPGFRAVVAGRVEVELKPRLAALNLLECVTLTGRVSEAEKFRLFKASRVFLMPSYYESWGIVIAEALACGTPVVAYELDAYRPIFGDLLRYVPCFNLKEFTVAAETAVRQSRSGHEMLPAAALAGFNGGNSWSHARGVFLDTFKTLKSLA